MNNDFLNKPPKAQRAPWDDPAMPKQERIDDLKAALNQALNELKDAKREAGIYKQAYEDNQREVNDAWAAVKAARKERDHYLGDLVDMQDKLAGLERRLNPVPGAGQRQMHGEPRRVRLQEQAFAFPPARPQMQQPIVGPADLEAAQMNVQAAQAEFARVYQRTLDNPNDLNAFAAYQQAAVKSNAAKKKLNAIRNALGLNGPAVEPAPAFWVDEPMPAQEDPDQ